MTAACAGKRGEHAPHLVWRDLVVLRPAEVENDAGRAQRNFRLLVQADGRCGVQSNAVPDQLLSAIVESMLARERTSCVGSFDRELRPGAVRDGRRRAMTGRRG